MGVALTSALLAALAAVTSLLAGHHSNEAMIERIRASDEWGYYQAKGIKAGVLGMKLELFASDHKRIDPKDEERLARYKEEQEEIQGKAKTSEQASEAHLKRHLTFARGVTLFQVAIAVAAISVLTKRRRFWSVSLVFGGVGVFFLALGLLGK